VLAANTTLGHGCVPPIRSRGSSTADRPRTGSGHRL